MVVAVVVAAVFAVGCINGAAVNGRSGNLLPFSCCFVAVVASLWQVASHYLSITFLAVLAPPATS